MMSLTVLSEFEPELQCLCLIPSDQRLDQQGVKNHSKMMVLKVSDAEWKQQLSETEEKKKNQNESIQRTQKGFQILSERGEVLVQHGALNIQLFLFKCVKTQSVSVCVDGVCQTAVKIRIRLLSWRSLTRRETR